MSDSEEKKVEAVDPMSPDEARERFSEAADEFLDDDEQAAFDAALAADDGLRAEYEAFAVTLGGVRGLGESLRGDVELGAEILPGFQKKLRERSRGRYYRDRFSEKQGDAWPMILALVTILLVSLAWFALRMVTVDF